MDISSIAPCGFPQVDRLFSDEIEHHGRCHAPKQTEPVDVTKMRLCIEIYEQEQEGGGGGRESKWLQGCTGHYVPFIVCHMKDAWHLRACGMYSIVNFGVFLGC